MTKEQRDRRRWEALGWAGTSVAYLALLLGGRPATATAPLAVIAVALAVVRSDVWLGGAFAAAVLGVEVLVHGWHPDLGYLAVALALSVALTQRVAGDARAARTRAAASARLLALAVSALRVVAQADREGDAHATLPGLLARDPASDLRVWRTSLGPPEVLAGGGDDPVSDAVAAAGVRAVVESGAAVYDVHRARGGARYLAALPVFERGDVARAITAVRRHPYDGPERHALEEFAGALGGVLTSLHGRREGELALALLGTTLETDSLTEQAAAVGELLRRELAVDGVVLLRYAGGRFSSLAIEGVVSPGLRARVEGGIAYGDGVVWEVYRDGRARFVEDYASDAAAIPDLVASGVRALGVVPVSGAPRCRHMLALVSGTERLWRAQDRALVRSVAVVLRAVLSRHESATRLAEMLRLERELLSTPASEMYSRLLHAAVRLVPGAEAGSLLVREPDGDYVFAATAGYDLETLRPVRFPADDMVRWYGGARAAWRAGTPRVLTSDEHRRVAEVSAVTAPDARVIRGGRVAEIESNLCLPVPSQGEVLAVLNLDALHDPDAFGEAALQAARAFAPLIGFLLREADVRRRLAQAARTDVLTGLRNRRAFDERLRDEVARAGRYGHPVALLVMDLRGFKEVNDRLGHAMGDEAIGLVAEALQRVSRATDHVYRWGGDEFAAVLPHTDAEEARALAHRCGEAVAAVSVGGMALRINIGVACYPVDGRDVDTLLRVADGRMYRAKAHGHTVEPSGG